MDKKYDGSNILEEGDNTMKYLLVRNVTGRKLYKGYLVSSTEIKVIKRIPRIVAFFMKLFGRLKI